MRLVPVSGSAVRKRKSLFPPFFLSRFVLSEHEHGQIYGHFLIQIIAVAVSQAAVADVVAGDLLGRFLVARLVYVVHRVILRNHWCSVRFECVDLGPIVDMRRTETVFRTFYLAFRVPWTNTGEDMPESVRLVARAVIFPPEFAAVASVRLKFQLSYLHDNSSELFLTVHPTWRFWLVGNLCYFRSRRIVCCLRNRYRFSPVFVSENKYVSIKFSCCLNISYVHKCRCFM